MPQATPITEHIEQTTNYLFWLTLGALITGLTRALFALKESCDEKKYLERILGEFQGLVDNPENVDDWISDNLCRLEILIERRINNVGIESVLDSIRCHRTANDSIDRVRRSIVIAISKRTDDIRRRKRGLLNPLHWVGLGILYPFHIPAEAIRTFELDWEFGKIPVVRQLLGSLTGVFWFLLTKVVADTFSFNISSWFQGLWSSS